MRVMRETNDDTTAHLEETKLSASDRRQRSQYLREFLPAMIAYSVLIAIVSGTVDEDTPAAEAWILLPLLPLIAVALAVYRSVQRADEYARLLQLEAMALAFGASMIAALALGLLGIVGVALSYGGWLVFAAGMATWGLAAGLKARG